MWKPGEVIAWRGIFRGKIWHAMPTFVVKDTQQELVLAILPGVICKVDRDYGREGGRRIWDFGDAGWQLEDFTWHTNRVLFIVEPGKYYSTSLFWNHATDAWAGYYVNFQHPCQRTHCGIDALDLELDIEVGPDLTFRWKDVDDYRRAIESGIISSESIRGVEAAKPEVLERLEKHLYPFDGSWLDWRPASGWLPPTLPENWDKI